jgi:hypothetical protein
LAESGLGANHADASLYSIDGYETVTTMAYDRSNVFAKILRGEIPSHKVHEDEHTLAFMDVMPQTTGTRS